MYNVCFDCFSHQHEHYFVQLSATSPPDFNNTCRDLTVFKIFPFCQIWLNFSNEFDKKKKKKGEGDRAENWQAGYTVLVLYLCCLPSELKLKISNNKTVNLRCRNELGISHFDLVRFVSEVCLRLSRSLVSELIASELHPFFIFDIYYRT